MKTQYLSDEQVLERTLDDPKLQAAIMSAVIAVFRQGEDKVDLNATLRGTIAWRLGVWSEHEVEIEGLDRDAC